MNTFEREWEAMLTQQLAACILTEQYPRSVVSVVLQILTADGSVLAACWHAAVSALMDAGVALRGLPVAVTCCGTTSSIGDTLLVRLDPVADEEQQADSVMTVVLNHQKQLLGCHTTTSMRQSPTQVLTCVSTAARAVPAVQAFWRLALEQKVTRESQTLWSGTL